MEDFYKNDGNKMPGAHCWDLNKVKEPDYNLIPAGTVARCVLSLSPGDSDVDLYLKKSKNTGAYYLDCTFTITEGAHAKRKIFHKQTIISHNELSANYGKMFIKHLLESANGISKRDTSERAEKVRLLKQLSDLDGIEVVVKIGIEPAGEYAAKNKILDIVTADSPLYKKVDDYVPF